MSTPHVGSGPSRANYLVTIVVAVIAAAGSAVAGVFGGRSSQTTTINNLTTVVASQSAALQVTRSAAAAPQATVTRTIPGPTVTVAGPTVTVAPGGSTNETSQTSDPMDGPFGKYNEQSISVTSDNWFDFDATPPNLNLGENTEGNYYGNELGSWTDGTFTVTPGTQIGIVGSTAPSYSTCADGTTPYVTSNPSAADIFEGQHFCMVTSGGRYATLSVIATTAKVLSLHVFVFKDSSDS